MKLNKMKGSCTVHNISRQCYRLGTEQKFLEEMDLGVLIGI